MAPLIGDVDPRKIIGNVVGYVGGFLFPPRVPEPTEASTSTTKKKEDLKKNAKKLFPGANVTEWMNQAAANEADRKKKEQLKKNAKELFPGANVTEWMNQAAANEADRKRKEQLKKNAKELFPGANVTEWMYRAEAGEADRKKKEEQKKKYDSKKKVPWRWQFWKKKK